LTVGDLLRTRKEKEQFRKPLDSLEPQSFDALLEEMRAKMREEDKKGE